MATLAPCLLATPPRSDRDTLRAVVVIVTICRRTTRWTRFIGPRPYPQMKLSANLMKHPVAAGPVYVGGQCRCHAHHMCVAAPDAITSKTSAKAAASAS